MVQVRVMVTCSLGNQHSSAIAILQITFHISQSAIPQNTNTPLTLT